MLLKKITLKDFRQFKGTQTVEFSTDKNKNITIILGENGAGKTTFAQAFSWCLYGSTEFSDPIVLNKKVSMHLGPSSEEKVMVELELIHRNRPYCITREQKYTTNSNGELNTPNDSILKIRYKSEDGQQEFIKENEVDITIKEILPKDLSRYFFFDGERINNMSKELNVGKSEEFAEAVRRLLGLAAFSNALNHLRSKNNANSVIRSYNSDYDAKADSKIAEYKDRISELDDKIEIKENRKEEIKKESENYKSQQDNYKKIMEENKESESFIRGKNRLETNLQTYQERHTQQINTIFSSFDKNIFSWLCKPIIKSIIPELKDTNTIDKGIPDITAKTIEFLKARKRCICGNCLELNSKEYKELEKLLEYIPPKSLGTFIGQFVSEANMRIENSKDYYNQSFLNKFSDIRTSESEISSIQNDINNIDEKLRNMKTTADVQLKYDQIVHCMKDLENEKETVLLNLGSLKENKERIESQLNELVLKDKANRKIATYKAYAQYMYNYLSEIYKQKEAEVRQELEKNINEIFKGIYDGKLSILIDERYNIKVIADEFSGFSGSIETSTAQSMSVIFAFIAGVIKMAKENRKDNDEEMRLDSEPYPLVMDAPLSSFDKKRVTNVCNTIPKIAEQVIMFSFDKDAEVAKENLGEKLGKNYEFIKVDEFETTFIEK